MTMAASGPLRPAAVASARPRTCAQLARRFGQCSARNIHLDQRQRLSRVWVPPPQVRQADVKEDEESHSKLLRAGFFRQAHSGLFHMLPLGLRVQDKIVALVDKHMKSIGASRLDMSSISTAKLWGQSGRLETSKSELFQFKDRKDADYLLSPTHEEEITDLVRQNVLSYRDLPLRLYQISRKYRDEMRPRHGILRSREFLMKDLYTFDGSVEDALETYSQVRTAYANIFAEMKLPVRSARASSGDMGGDLSHEYHLAASLGEDYVAHCSSCDYTANTEVAQVPAPKDAAAYAAGDKAFSGFPQVSGVRVWRGISRDRLQLVNVWYPAATVDPATGVKASMDDADIDTQLVRQVVPDLDVSVLNPADLWDGVLEEAEKQQQQQQGPKPKLVNLVDWRLLPEQDQLVDPFSWPTKSKDKDNGSIEGRIKAAAAEVVTIFADTATGQAFNFAKPRTGDDCPSCGAHGTLAVEKAIELGHTFYLGTRYTDVLGVRVLDQEAGKEAGKKAAASASLMPLMGCYGIGISRILGAVADHLAEKKGLNWPRAIAPYEVVVVTPPPAASSSSDGRGGEDLIRAAEKVHDVIAGWVEAGPPDGRSPQQGRQPDVICDDRNVSLPWKLKDADLVGYPVVAVVGNSWKKSVKAGADENSALVEVQCRQLQVRQDVPLSELRVFVEQLLEKL